MGKMRTDPQGRGRASLLDFGGSPRLALSKGIETRRQWVGGWLTSFSADFLPGAVRQAAHDTTWHPSPSRVAFQATTP